jgi:hypothetical protein
LETGFICFAYNNNKLQSLNISSSTSFALELALTLELEFLWDQLEPGTWLCVSLVSLEENIELELTLELQQLWMDGKENTYFQKFLLLSYLLLLVTC